MAELRTDFKDDILAEAMGGRRRYQMIQNEDGTVSFVDVTEYEQVGSEFGQAEINATNAAVIALQNERVETADPMTATEEGLAADAKLTGEALRDLSANFQGAADAIGDAISGLGVTVPEGATLLEMADIIKSSLYKPPTSQSGTVNLRATIKYIEPGKTFTGSVTFPKAFAKNPSIRLSGTCGRYFYQDTYSLNVRTTSVSTTGFTYIITNSYSFDIDAIIFTWSANA